MKLILSLAVLFLSPAVFAATWNEKCPNLARCIQAMTEISGQKYLYSRDVGEVKVAFSRNFPFSSVYDGSRTKRALPDSSQGWCFFGHLSQRCEGKGSPLVEGGPKECARPSGNL